MFPNTRPADFAACGYPVLGTLCASKKKRSALCTKMVEGQFGAQTDRFHRTIHTNHKSVGLSKKNYSAIRKQRKQSWAKEIKRLSCEGIQGQLNGPKGADGTDKEGPVFTGESSENRALLAGAFEFVAALFIRTWVECSGRGGRCSDS